MNLPSGGSKNILCVCLSGTSSEVLLVGKSGQRLCGYSLYFYSCNIL